MTVIELLNSRIISAVNSLYYSVHVYMRCFGDLNAFEEGGQESRS